jgi:hypothetical protein
MLNSLPTIHYNILKSFSLIRKLIRTIMVTNQLGDIEICALYSCRLNMYVVVSSNVSEYNCIWRVSGNDPKFIMVPGPIPTRNRTIATGLSTRKPRQFQLGSFYHQKPDISTSQVRLRLCILVLIASWHDQHVNCAGLCALSPPVFGIYDLTNIRWAVIETPPIWLDIWC